MRTLLANVCVFFELELALALALVIDLLALQAFRRARLAPPRPLLMARPGARSPV